jgi:hypothetical protein
MLTVDDRRWCWSVLLFIELRVLLIVVFAILVTIIKATHLFE